VFGVNTEKDYKFWQAYSLQNKKVIDKNKRSNKSYLDLKKSIMSLLPEKYYNLELSESLFGILSSINPSPDVLKLHKKWKRMTQKGTAEVEISYDDFDEDEITIDDKELILDLNDIHLAERKHYGFQFTCRLSTFKMYDPSCTFANSIELHANGVRRHNVQIEVLDVNVKYSKNNKSYCQLIGMDSEFRIERINVWADDYVIFKHILEKNNCLSIQVSPPTNGFSTFSLNSPPQHKRYLLPSNTLDYRIVLIN
jgi:hypothetical protein